MFAKDSPMLYYNTTPFHEFSFLKSFQFLLNLWKLLNESFRNLDFFEDHMK